jgi:hypothetical protein
MSLLVSNSIPTFALKKMPSVCADILEEKQIEYFESLELFTSELREMSVTLFKDSVIDMVAFNPVEFQSATWLFQEAFCRIYSDLSEAMLFELSQTASDLVDNLQDYFWDFKIHPAELRILETFYKTTKKYAFINHLRSDDYNLLVAIIESEKLLEAFKHIPDDINISDFIITLEDLSFQFEYFLMDNPLCPNFLFNSQLSKKIHTILEFNYEFLYEEYSDNLIYNSDLKNSFRPFSIKSGCKEFILSNQDLWESYCSYILDCLKIEILFSSDKISWAIANSKYHFYKNDFELSFSALKKTQSLIIDKLLKFNDLNTIDLAMFKRRVDKLEPKYKNAFESLKYYLKTLRNYQLNSIYKFSKADTYLIEVLALYFNTLETFTFLTDLFQAQDFLINSQMSNLTKYMHLNPEHLNIIHALRNQELFYSKEFLNSLIQNSLKEASQDLSEVLL